MFQIRLKELREKAGYSQYSFADSLGVAQSTVGNWEAGKREPNFETTQRIADFFNVTTDYLFGRENSPNSAYTPAVDKKKEIKYLIRIIPARRIHKRKRVFK